ncbi:MAG: phosphoenolpyruvate synthase [Prevotellaceae bacterium]|jgi:CheY-like chemotaxis protein|nr:phosphoenolpyruvate synthase [Prevotellaceae bacterium]
MQQPNIKQLYFKDTSFANLMKHRIYNVLLYASRYDAFTLEEDGRIDEQIFNEYVSLHLRYPPRFRLVTSEDEAAAALGEVNFDLIISMPAGDTINPFEWAKKVKNAYRNIPIVALVPFSRIAVQHLANEDLSAIDYVFSWLGDPEILLAIIKLIEDKMNIDEDIQSVGVQAIIFVENSIRFYSSIIPRLYKFMFKQSHSFMTEALNDHERMLRMRGRPKILFARNYEEAMELYEKYADNILGVISDVEFEIKGKENRKAGIRLCGAIRKRDKYVPLIIESTDYSNKLAADHLSAAFIYKLSKTFFLDLRKQIAFSFGFGDFKFLNPFSNITETQVKNLKDLQDNIFNISDECLSYHISRNDISRWLYSRAMFPLAEFLKNVDAQMLNNSMDNVRQVIFDAIVTYRKIKNRGVVAIFDPKRYDKYSNFARLGDGSLGGKGRGLAFVDAMIKRNENLQNVENVNITIPKTLVLCTDIFAEFMETNRLYDFALSEVSDEKILERFLLSTLPEWLYNNIRAFMSTVCAPLAVRSSSLLEDSNYQPFAGIYSTYMLPFDSFDMDNTVAMVAKAIKAVYASVYYSASKAYMRVTKNVIDEERMAVILQEICGAEHGSRFYPSFSGVAQSFNYYPLGAEKSSEGVVNVAFGLGKYIVDGGRALRFSPAHPNNVLQTSTIPLVLKETQDSFFALNLDDIKFQPKIDDAFNLLKINVQDAEKDGTLKFIASTYSYREQMLYDNSEESGRKLITFANILKHNVFPLAEILKNLLSIAQREMGRPVEMEFAVKLDYSPAREHTFYLLQVRPIVDSNETLNENLDKISQNDAIVTCKNALGHGIQEDIHDLIYVKPETFDAAKNAQLAEEIGLLNAQLAAKNRHYILIGPGRWGSSDPWLGIPVKWQHISNARVIVESGLPDYRIDPSQGTHFFQNLTSLGVFYFTINPFSEDGSYDVEYLNSQKAKFETDKIRHLHFTKPLIAKADGKKAEGIIMKM